MADVIKFPQRTVTQTLHFEEKHAFGEIGGLMLSLVQQQGKEDAPFTLVLFGGNDVFFPLEGFEPTPEGLELAKTTGEITLRALAVGYDNWSK
jgi:lysophospholipase L1-like esterase